MVPGAIRSTGIVPDRDGYSGEVDDGYSGRFAETVPDVLFSPTVRSNLNPEVLPERAGMRADPSTQNCRRRASHGRRRLAHQWRRRFSRVEFASGSLASRLPFRAERGSCAACASEELHRPRIRASAIQRTSCRHPDAPLYRFASVAGALQSGGWPPKSPRYTGARAPYLCRSRTTPAVVPRTPRSTASWKITSSPSIGRWANRASGGTRVGTYIGKERVRDDMPHSRWARCLRENATERVEPGERKAGEDWRGLRVETIRRASRAPCSTTGRWLGWRR